MAPKKWWLVRWCGQIASSGAFVHGWLEVQAAGRKDAWLAADKLCAAMIRPPGFSSAVAIGELVKEDVL